MHRLWPLPATAVAVDEVTALYAPTDRAAPRLRTNFVSSLDGAVSLDGFSAGLSGDADKLVFGLLRTLADALVVAAGTLRAEGYGAMRLSDEHRAWRVAHGLPEHLPLVVVSGRLVGLDPGHPAFAEAPTRPVVITHAASPADRRAALETVADVVVAGATSVDLTVGLAELRARGWTQVLCEGGPRLLGALTEADLVDEFCLTVSPLLAGPGAGRITAGTVPHAPRHLPLRHVLAEDDTLLLRYAR